MNAQRCLLARLLAATLTVGCFAAAVALNLVSR